MLYAEMGQALRESLNMKEAYTLLDTSNWTDDQCKDWLWDHAELMIDEMNSDLSEEEYEDIGIQTDDDYITWMDQLTTDELRDVVQEYSSLV